MARQRYPLDRSAAFTALLHLAPEGFGKSSDPETTKTISEFLESWYGSDDTDMYKHAQNWLTERQHGAQRAADGAEVEWFDHPHMKLPDVPEAGQ